MQLLDQIVAWLVPAMCGGAVTLAAVAWIIRIHREYVQSGRPIPVEVMDEADDAYDAYSALGGNGTGTKMHDEIMAAHNGPTRKEHS